MKKIIELKNITKAFDGEPVLQNVNLDIYDNEFITLLGPSGCGKTTMLRLIGGFETPDEGDVLFLGKKINDVLKLSIELDDAARQWLVDKGDDSKYGARPLRRTIQNEVEDVLAERILMGKVHAGNKVKITVKDNKLNFTLKRGMNK